jgi:hypothetical protein
MDKSLDSLESASIHQWINPSSSGTEDSGISEMSDLTSELSEENQFPERVTPSRIDIDDRFKEKTEIEYNLTTQHENELSGQIKMEHTKWLGDRGSNITYRLSGPESQSNDWIDYSPDIVTSLENIQDINAEIDILNQASLRVLEDKMIDNIVRTKRDHLKKDLTNIKDMSREARRLFKTEARKKFLPYKAEEIIQDPIILRNIQLLKDTQKTLTTFDELIKERGLDLCHDIDTKSWKVWPVFTGNQLPTLNDFLMEFNELCIDEGHPMSNRGHILCSQVRGTAKNFLNSQLNELNSSYYNVKNILMLGFGRNEHIEELLIRLHSSLQPISFNSDYTINHRIVKDHRNLANAMMRQIGRWKKTKLGEKPISWRYCRTIEGMLPKTHLFNLYSVPHFANLDSESRFDQVQKELEKLHNFTNACLVINHKTLYDQIPNQQTIYNAPPPNSLHIIDFSKPPPNVYYPKF